MVSCRKQEQLKKPCPYLLLEELKWLSTTRSPLSLSLSLSLLTTLATGIVVVSVVWGATIVSDAMKGKITSEDRRTTW